MRIVIDMQGAQSESRYRGIGRYATAFAQAVARNRGDHEVILALNGMLPESVEPIRAAFENSLCHENIRLWHAPRPVLAGEPGNETRRKVAMLLREDFLKSLQPDIIHITSLFEGYVDDALTDIPPVGSTAPVTATLYDLIPLLNREQYLKPHPSYESFYLSKVRSLQKASALLAISDATRLEGLEHLRIRPERIINVGAAVDGRFAPRPVSAEQRTDLLGKLGITRPFVLYTGGADERKNLPRLVRGFAGLPPEVRCRHQLVLAGRFVSAELPVLKNEIKETGLRADEILLTGYVSDDEIINLYNLCTLFVFPSWHEGFGLPALEAMSCGAVVIGGAAGSLPEVIGLQEALFNPFEVGDITEHIRRALTDHQFRDRLLAHGRTQATLFSWDKTAQRSIAVWESLRAPGSLVRSRQQEASDIPQFAKLLGTTAAKFKKSNLVGLAACVAENRQAGLVRQILLDISGNITANRNNNLPHAERCLLSYLSLSPLEDVCVAVVSTDADGNYRYVENCDSENSEMYNQVRFGEPVIWQRGDILCGFLTPPNILVANAALYADLRSQGITVKFFVDKAQAEFPISISPDSESKTKWYTVLAASDGIILSSEAAVDAFAGFDVSQTILPGARLEDRVASFRAQVLANHTRHQLLVDISELVQQDAKSGIQRVVRSILTELLSKPPVGYRVEPVYATLGRGYRYARRFIKSFYNKADAPRADEPIDYAPGDLFLGLDLQPGVVAAHEEFYQHLRRHGVNVQFVVYDLLCVLHPEHFPLGAKEVFTRWLEVVRESDGAVCITENVAKELGEWVEAHPPKQRKRSFALNWFHLGADVENSLPSSGMPAEAGKVLHQLGKHPTFLMVGTLEPRKGHAQVLAAFEELWADGRNLNLVIVGKQGWMVDDLCGRIKCHEQYNNKLFWLEGISDEYLERIYAASTCLLAASYGEGFGLPLIEAARHGVPILARDIPVFREVAGEAAAYFRAEEAKDLAASLVSWLEQLNKGTFPNPNKIQHYCWKESAAVLLSRILPKPAKNSCALPLFTTSPRPSVGSK